MEHLFGISAYQFDLDTYGGMHEAIRKVMNAGGDGVELLTGYFQPDAAFKGVAKGIHLPYATDWYSVWTGDTGYIDHMDDDGARYMSYGRDRDEMVHTLVSAIGHASVLSPAYGVFHASNVRMGEVMGFTYSDKNEDVLRAVAELLNRTAASFPEGEPPFTIVLENLWWPGLTMTDDIGFRILDDALEFSNWGLCLDTGHLMNSLGHCRYEEEGIRDVLDTVRSYPAEMKDKIHVVHLHMSLSADHRERCIRDPVRPVTVTDGDMMSRAYEHVCKIDQHRPFTDTSCKEIVRTVSPKYLTHEISAPSASERISGFAGQRSLFR